MMTELKVAQMQDAEFTTNCCLHGRTKDTKKDKKVKVKQEFRNIMFTLCNSSLFSIICSKLFAWIENFISSERSGGPIKVLGAMASLATPIESPYTMTAIKTQHITKYVLHANCFKWSTVSFTATLESGINVPPSLINFLEKLHPGHPYSRPPVYYFWDYRIKT